MNIISDRQNKEYIPTVVTTTVVIYTKKSSSSSRTSSFINIYHISYHIVIIMTKMANIANQAVVNGII